MYADLISNWMEGRKFPQMLNIYPYILRARVCERCNFGKSTKNPSLAGTHSFILIPQ